METIKDIMYLRKMCEDGSLAYRNMDRQLHGLATPAWVTGMGIYRLGYG